MEREEEQQVGKKTAYRERFRKTVEFVEYVDESEMPQPEPPPGVITPDIAGTDQSVGLSFLGATLADTRAYPPDSMGAAGPSQYIVAVNGRIRSFNKHTGLADGVLNVDTDVFFNPVMTPPVTNNFTSDPRIRYDRLSGRWFIVMIDVPGSVGNLANRVMLAVSDGPVIAAASSWTFFYFPGDAAEFADYPTLGIDANALYIGVNLFGTRGQGSFDNTTGFVVRKSSLLAATNAPANIFVTAFTGLVPNGNNGGPYTPQGVDNYDPNATEGYFIGATSSHTFLFFDRLSLRRVSNPGGTPTISSTVYITIPGSGGTINVPHLGNTGGAAGNLDGLDFRLLAAHIRNGRLWTAQNIAVNNAGSPSGTDTRMGVRWYELNGIATGQTPGVVQAATLFQPSAGNTSDQRSYWMGSIMVSGQGHAMMGFSVAGANEFANAGWAGRLAGDPLNSLRPASLYTATSSAYNPHDSGGAPINRWGDYSYTCLDPDDDMTMWTIQEFCNASNSYGVQIAKVLAPPPAIPTNCSPASVTAGTTVNVVVTGMSNGDTGFFDPGPGFSNRLAAAISGAGVTVNSIAYSNPTQFTLNLSVAALANSGARAITVTNPDGQTAVSPSAILTVVGITNPTVLADFVGAPTGGAAPRAVYFTNQSVFANSYSWDFGDGQTSTAANPMNVYSNPGNYSVTLTAFRPGGSNSLTRTNYVNLTLAPPLLIERIAVSNGVVDLAWSAISNRTYRVQFKDDLSVSNWADQIPDTIAEASSISRSYASPGATRFYRVQLLP
jgi:PKD repeat protein